MNLSTTSTVFAGLLALVFLVSCAGSNSTSSPATVAENVAKEANTLDHRPARDTVDWHLAYSDGQPPWSNPTDREWPGEEIGVIGPIIAMGGQGSKAYISIYDPAGVFIGALYLKDARKDPGRLEDLLRLAQARGAVQNSRTIERASVLRFLSLAEEARQKEMP